MMDGANLVQFRRPKGRFDMRKCEVCGKKMWPWVDPLHVWWHVDEDLKKMMFWSEKERLK